MDPPRGSLLLLAPLPGPRAEVAGLLQAAGFLVEQRADLAAAEACAREERFDLLLCLSSGGGEEDAALARAVTGRPGLPPTTFLGPAPAAEAAAGLERIPWPQPEADFLLAVAQLVDKQRLQGEVRVLRARLEIEHSLDHLVARDPKMLAAFDQVRAVAPTRATLLVSGESGTGKSLLAEAVHRLSDRAGGPFVTVSCGAIPESLLESELFGHARGSFTGAFRDKAGRFEEADGGTLFLDEVGTASPALQVKLLRFLQDRAFERVGESRTRSADVRLIFATNTDLHEAVRTGAFRQDLLFRVEVIHVELPPLRERPSDIMPLTRRLLSRLAAAHERPIPRISRPAARLLLRHSWPGNVRELANALERGLLLCRDDRIQPEHLPEAVCGPARRETDGIPLPVLEPGQRYALKELLAEPERRILAEALRVCQDDREAAADLLGIDRSTLYARMRRLGMTRPRGGSG